MIDKVHKWMNPKWSPYGESPHGKMLYRLSYPRRLVRGHMLACGIMRLRQGNCWEKYPRCIVLFMPFPVVCRTSHNSSRLESYGHEKLETPGLGNGPKFV
jgi:hypothetical protein